MANRSTNKELWFMKLKLNKKRAILFDKRFLIVLALAIFLVPAKLVFAQTNGNDSSSSATQNGDENSTIDNIKKVIQEKKTELGTAGANLRSERAYLAKVTRVSEETLAVANYSGNKIIPLDDSIVVQKKGKDIKISDVVIDNWVGVYGEMVDDNLKIKKITVYDHDFAPKDKIIALGSISDIGKNDMSLSPRSGDEELHFSFGKNTSFQDSQGEEIDQSDFYKDLQCLVVAFTDGNGNYVVSTVRALSAFEK